MNNIKEIIEQMKKDHANMDSGNLSKNHASVRAKNYKTIGSYYTGKLAHDKHYGIHDPSDFYKDGK